MERNDLSSGFTLIELLSIIVMLAIIVLIATPIILNIIEDSKYESKIIGIKNYLSVIEREIARENINGKFNPTECEVEGKELKCFGYQKSLNIEIDGEIPDKGIIILKNGIVTNGSVLTIGNYVIRVTNNNISLNPKNIYKNGDIVYFDIKEGKGCTDYHEDNSKTGYNGLNPTGNQNSCLKFYAFNDDDEGDILNLLLDHNTTDSKAWVLQKDFSDDEKWNNSLQNIKGPLTLLKQLKKDTDGWSDKIKTPNSYIFEENQNSYVINYSGYKARLITAEEIIKITKKKSEPTTYYFDTLANNPNDACIDNDENTLCSYGWLYDRTSISCKEYGCLNGSNIKTEGYWTATAGMKSSNKYAWFVYYDGRLSYTNVVASSRMGVRPVIEVYKYSLK